MRASSHDSTTWPRLLLSPAQDAAQIGVQAERIDLQAFDDEGLRIDQHLAQLREPRLPATEQQQARLGGDGHAHQIGDLEAGAADELFLGEEHLDVASQLRLQSGRQAAVERLALQDRATRLGQRPGAHPLAPPRSHERLSAEPGRDEARRRRSRG